MKDIIHHLCGRFNNYFLSEIGELLTLTGVPKTAGISAHNELFTNAGGVFVGKLNFGIRLQR